MQIKNIQTFSANLISRVRILGNGYGFGWKKCIAQLVDSMQCIHVVFAFPFCGSVEGDDRCPSCAEEGSGIAGRSRAETS